MTYVVVVAHKGGRNTHRVFTGRDLEGALSKVRKAFRLTGELKPPRDTVPWTPAIDECITRNYKVIPASALANVLSDQFKLKISKNSVISRYHRLTKTQK